MYQTSLIYLASNSNFFFEFMDNTYLILEYMLLSHYVLVFVNL